MSDKFACLDAYFKSLPNAVKRISLSEEVIASLSEASRSAPREGRSEGGHEEGEEQASDREGEEHTHRAVATFHGLADAVVVVLARIQELVRRKQSEFTAAQGSKA